MARRGHEDERCGQYPLLAVVQLDGAGVHHCIFRLLGNNFPPIQPDVPASEVADYFRTNANSIKLGMVIAMSFAPAYGVWGYALAKVTEHIVEKDSILVQLSRVGAAWTTLAILVATSFWLTAAFRPDALPDGMIQLLYDMAWLLIDLAYTVTTVQMFALGTAYLSDKRAVPLIPKWLAWYGIWVGFMFIAECVMPFLRAALSAWRMPLRPSTMTRR